MQLDLFEKDEVKLLMQEVEKIRVTAGNVQRGLFARHNELAKMFLQLRQDFDTFKNSVGYKMKPTQMLDFFNEKVS